MSASPAETLELRTTAMASNGTAVAREDSGRVVFVAGALPGEVVRVTVDSERDRYATGRVLDVLEPSSERVAPPCRHVAEGCGGCQWQHARPDIQVAFKEQIVVDAIRRLGRLPSPPLHPTIRLEPWAYRTTLRVAVRDGRAALRESRSNDTTVIDGCLIVHPLLAELLAGARYGGACEVILRCGARTGERLAAPNPRDSLIDVPSGVERRHFTEQAAGRTWRVSARSFFQTRPDGVDALAGLVLGAASELGAPSSALDLYSGVGVFAGVLASQGWSVTAVEGSASSIADARHNLRDPGVNVVRADITRWVPERADLVVADPSRNGLGGAGVSVVRGSGARRLVLISCDAGSLGRDTGLLAEAGYLMESVTLVDLFPHTFHVEAVSVFDRAAVP